MKDSVIKYVSFDKDVKINHFEDYLERHFPMVNQESSVREVKNVEEIPEGFTVVHEFATRGATSRPGFGTAGIETDRLRNAPDEEGVFEVANADVIPLATYKKMSLDPTISEALRLIKGWIGGLKYTVKTSDPEVEAVISYALDKVWTGLTSDMLDAFIYGFQFGEKVWQREDVELEDPLVEDENKIIFKGKIVTYKKIKFLDPTLEFKYFKDKNDEIVKVVQAQSRGEVSVDRDKLVWFALDKAHSNIFGTSRLKPVYKSWYYSEINHQYWIMDNENRGAPPLETRYPMGKTRVNGAVVENEILAAQLAQMLTNSGKLLIPSDKDESGNYRWEVKYLDTRQGSGPNPFDQYLTMSDKKKLQAMGVPEAMLREASFGQADAATDFFIVILEDLVNQMETVIQSDVVNPLVDNNFGPAYVSRVKVVIDKSGLGRKKLFRDVLINVLRMSASIPGYEPRVLPSIEDIGTELGLPVKPLEQVLRPSLVPREGGESLLDEMVRDEASNDPDQHRVNKPDQTEQERNNKKNSATDTV